MTEQDRQYCLANWKQKTSSQLALELSTAEHVVRPADVHNYLTKRGIQPITKRDIITKEVIEVFTNGGNTQVATIARKLGTSQQLIKEIIEDLDLTTRQNKPGPKTKRDLIDAGKVNEERAAAIAARDARRKEIRANRAGFTIYNQTGSPLLDELRNIKTTKREKTLLSTGKK